MSTVQGTVQEYVERGADRLALHFYPEPDATDAPVLVLWPAMGVPARYYRSFAAALREAGFAVIVVDLRGTGASTPTMSRRSRHGYAELVDDVDAVLHELKPRVNGRRVLLLGHSLGGQMCALHLALTAGSTVDGLVLVAVGLGLPWYRCYPGLRRAAVFGFTQGIAAVTAMLGVWPGWRFGGRQARGVIRDWAYTARHGRFPRLGEVDPNAALAAVRTPVLAVSVEADQYTPAPVLDHLCGMLTAAPVDRRHLTPAQAGAGIDHFTWVRAHGPLVDWVARFAATLR
jgi:predicted alpha/beta hydrolase